MSAEPLPVAGPVFVGVEIFVFRHSDLFPKDPWQVWSGPFPSWCEANAWIAAQKGWPGPMRAGRKAIVWETPAVDGAAKNTSSQVVVLRGGTELTPGRCKTALDEAMTIIEAVGTTGIHTGTRIRNAQQWMERYYPAWA